ncbi:hypothetical protein D9M70_412050 [compost metagenome]
MPGKVTTKVVGKARGAPDAPCAGQTVQGVVTQCLGIGAVLQVGDLRGVTGRVIGVSQVQRQVGPAHLAFRHPQALGVHCNAQPAAVAIGQPAQLSVGVIGDGIGVSTGPCGSPVSVGGIVHHQATGVGDRLQTIQGVVAIAEGQNTGRRAGQDEALAYQLVVEVVGVVPGVALIGGLRKQPSGQVVLEGEGLAVGMGDAHRAVHGVIAEGVGCRRAHLAGGAIAHGVVAVQRGLGFRVDLTGEEPACVIGVAANQPALFDGQEPAQVVPAKCRGDAARLDRPYQKFLGRFTKGRIGQGRDVATFVALGLGVRRRVAGTDRAAVGVT